MTFQLVCDINAILDGIVYVPMWICAWFTKPSERCKLFTRGNKVYFKVGPGVKQEYIVLRTIGDRVVISHEGKKK
jgi:hypothetical protein